MAPCTRCYGILACSKYCKTKAWSDFHKRDCSGLVAIGEAGAAGLLRGREGGPGHAPESPQFQPLRAIPGEGACVRTGRRAGRRGGG